MADYNYEIISEEEHALRWRIIPGFECYEVSDIGDVWSTIGVGKYLKPIKDKDGYLYVVLRPGKPELRKIIRLKYVRKYIHQLVLLAWKGPCPIGLECSHKDNNILNNDIDNLEYKTHLENMRDRYANGTYQEYNNKVLIAEQVIKIKILIEGGCIKSDIAKYFNIGNTTIFNLINESIWKHIKIDDISTEEKRKIITEFKADFALSLLQ